MSEHQYYIVDEQDKEEVYFTGTEQECKDWLWDHVDNTGYSVLDKEDRTEEPIVRSTFPLAVPDLAKKITEAAVEAMEKVDSDAIVYQDEESCMIQGEEEFVDNLIKEDENGKHE